MDIENQTHESYFISYFKPIVLKLAGLQDQHSFTIQTQTLGTRDLLWGARICQGFRFDKSFLLAHGFLGWRVQSPTQNRTLSFY